MGKVLRKNRGFRQRRREYGAAWETELIVDVIEAIRSGKSQTQIAAELNVGQRSIIKYVHRALEMGLLTLNSGEGSQILAGFYQRFFPGVEVQIVSAKSHFHTVAARQLLEWLRKAYERLPDEALTATSHSDLPYVAIGGGQALFEICQNLPQAIKGPEYADLTEWLNAREFVITNATAGGQIWHPEIEAAKLACSFGVSLRKDVGVYSNTQHPALAEKKLIEAAVKNTFFIVAEVNPPEDAEGSKLLAESGLRLKDFENPTAELLYHPFNRFGPRDSESWLDIKENQLNSDSIHPSAQNVAPVVTSLFSISSLKGRPPSNYFRPRWLRNVAAFVNCNDANRLAKASSLLTVLSNKYLTHLCIPYDLAIEIRACAESRNTVEHDPFRRI